MENGIFFRFKVEEKGKKQNPKDKQTQKDLRCINVWRGSSTLTVGQVLFAHCFKKAAARVIRGQAAPVSVYSCIPIDHLSLL